MESSILQGSMQQDYMMQKKMEILLDMNNKKFAAEIIKLNSTVTRLETELNDLKRKVNTGSQQRTASGPVQTQLAEDTQQRDNTKPIDRNGVSPSDVSIEKFFNFGRR